jgi:murein DD-endopeptidase MepM/ murein hydrolase activator NlpD
MMIPHTLLLLLCAVALESTGVRNETITFTHRERSLQPGELVLFEVRSSHPLNKLTIEAFDREFPGFSGENGLAWTGLVGIDLETKPGRYGVKVRGADTEGRSLTAEGTLKVKAKKFPTRELKVDQKYVSPPEDVLARIQEESKRVSGIFASTAPQKYWDEPFSLPVPGQVISEFGKRNIYNGQPRSPHTGVDFRGATGTPIRAPNAGKVVLAANLYYSGNTVILDHGLGLYSYLGHMSALAVKEGDPVKAGDIVGKVGATGRVTGPHLHWTVRLDGTRIDPLSLVDLLGSSQPVRK